MKPVLAIAALVFLWSGDVFAQTRPEFHVTRATQPPKIDGVLNDEVWNQAPLTLGDWLSYNPFRGEMMPPELRTEVRIAYDDRNLYFAFHCFDNEHEKIRTNISRRDTAFNDDWIAMSLDSTGTGQTAYHLFANPSGSQMDAINTTASGEQFDADLVWDSAGKVTDDGYIVEIQLPLQTLRFSSGSDVRMGILFFRKISRTGFSYSWPAMPPGEWVFERHARLVFSDLTQPRLFELLPSITYGVSQRRDVAGPWGSADHDTNLGMSGKFGITSNVTLDGTINPDFSQVESDAFQVEVNQRFPIFFSEKRPFFMEGMGLFNVAGAGSGNMRTAVHTRRIVDPYWGTKVTGTAGKATFGVLNALDERPDDLGNRGIAVAGEDKLFTVARATYALRGSDYVGAIVTDTEHAGRYNRVVGADLAIKFSSPQQLFATVLASDTAVESSSGRRGIASQVGYSYDTRRFSWSSQIEHYERAFQMDTAFYNRTGFTAGWSSARLNFYPSGNRDFWLQQVSPFGSVRRGRDEVQGGSEDGVTAGIFFNFPRQAHIEVSHDRGHEPWLGRQFRTGGGVNLSGSAQILRWLNIYTGFSSGYQIFYDAVDPFQGDTRGASFGLSFQPNQHFTQAVDVNMVRFDRTSTGERVYSVDIANLRTTYQFDKHFFVRLLSQFDSSTHRLLTDLLASYEFVPGTVFHAGYGSLYEKRPLLGAAAPASDGPPGSLVPDAFGEKYVTVNRGLFFKASYLHRF